MSLVDLFNRMPGAGVRVDLCRRIDVSCAEPVETRITDASGSVTLTLEAAFSGYAWVQSDAFVPVLYFFNPTVDHDQTIPPISLSTPGTRSALVSQLGADPTRGDVLINVEDCLGTPAEGVVFSVTPPDPSAIPYYLVQGLPTSGVSATDATGYGGFMNLSNNATTVTATVKGTNVAVGTIGLVVRGGSSSWSRFAFGR